MEASSEAVKPGLEPTAVRTRAAPPSRTPSRSASLYDRYKVAIVAYLATRVLLIIVAIVDGWLHTRSFTHEIGNWDGYWYQMMANHGYPSHVIHGQSTLGFFPLYPMAMWALMQLTFGSAAASGLIISTIGGLVAAVLVQELATEWWDEAAGRRAAILFCLFPGSVVFTMVYSEGLLIPLAAGCLLALQRRRWVLAGVLAGLATAVNATALPLIVVCAASARSSRRSCRSRESRRSRSTCGDTPDRRPQA
jgi:Gpi18-like mannosyltransferase